MDSKRLRVERTFRLLASALRRLVEDRLGSAAVSATDDPGPLCALILSRWDVEFADLGSDARSLVSAIEAASARAPHLSSFSDRDLLGLVDSGTRLLEAIGAPEGLELAIVQCELRRPAPPARALWRWSGAAAAVVFVFGGVSFLQWACASGHKAAGTAPAPRPVTICGSVTRVSHADGTAGGATQIVLRDARSGAGFTIVIPAAARPAFVSALGTDPENAYAGRSLCVTGAVGNSAASGTIEVSSPSAIHVNDAR